MTRNVKLALKCAALLAAGALALLFSGSPVKAASHSDAPLIKLDPQANITDVYSFIRQDEGTKVLYVVVNVRPFSNPGDGVSYEKFSDDARYSIHLTDPSTGVSRVRYDFQFSSVTTPGYKNLNTILNYGLGTEAGPIQDVGDARQNYTQRYMVTKVELKGKKEREVRSTILESGLLVPPANVGERTTPFYNDTEGRAISGATSFATLDRYTQQTVYSLSSGEEVFAGSREDSFFADTPGIFDLLNPRILDTDGTGVDDFKGYNVLTYAMSIPVSSLPLQGNPVIGVYASVSRAHVTLRDLNDGEVSNSGPFVQVNRMGNPLFNEVLVAVGDKDNYNRTSPRDDNARFRKYAENPEVAFLINFVYGSFLQSTFGRQLKTTGRSDIAGIYMPDVLRVDTSTGPVPIAGEVNFHRLSFLGGDLTDGKPSGWPNGRRLGDDVVDIALIAVANAPGESPTIILGDNVNGNDQVYNLTFPYAATPHSGTNHRYDPEP